MLLLDKAISLHLESFFVNRELDPLGVYLGSGGYFDIVSELSSVELEGLREYEAQQLDLCGPNSEDVPENEVEKVRMTTRKYVWRHGTGKPTRRAHKHNRGEEWVADDREQERGHRGSTIPPYLLKAPLIAYDDFLP